MTRHMRQAAAFCLLLLIALLVNLTRVQVAEAPAYNRNPANGRTAHGRSAPAHGDRAAVTARRTTPPPRGAARRH